MYPSSGVRSFVLVFFNYIIIIDSRIITSGLMEYSFSYRTIPRVSCEGFDYRIISKLSSLGVVWEVSYCFKVKVSVV